jgi:hypothetical protein
MYTDELDTSYHDLSPENEYDKFLLEIDQRKQARITSEYRGHASFASYEVGWVFSLLDGSQRKVLKLINQFYASGCDLWFVYENLSQKGETNISWGTDSVGKSIQVVDQKAYDTHIFGWKKAYEILWISEQDGLMEAKRQYNRLTNAFHPDRPWKRRWPEFDSLMDRLKEIWLHDMNGCNPWIINWHDPWLEGDGWGIMTLYYSFIQRVIDGKVSYKVDQSEESRRERINKASLALSLMKDYIWALGEKFYQVCKAYELFSQWFGSLDIFATYLTWTHHYRISMDPYENSLIEWSVIELPGTFAKIFIPIKWITCIQDGDKRTEEVLPMKDFSNIRITEALLIFDTTTEDDIFAPGRAFSRTYVPFESRIFDIVGSIEWNGDGEFSAAYTQALKSRFPDIENPEKILISHLDVEEVSESDLLSSQYWNDFCSVCESLKQRWTYWIEQTEGWEILFFQNNETLRLSKEDIEILRYIALNLNLIRQSILTQLGPNS